MPTEWSTSHQSTIQSSYRRSSAPQAVNSFFFFLILFIYLFIYLWLCWVSVSVRGLSLVAASGGHSSSRCAGLSLWQPLLLRSTGSRRAGSVVVAHEPSCSAACGIFPDQGSNPCPLHWQADSQPLCHQGSPGSELLLLPTFTKHVQASAQMWLFWLLNRGESLCQIGLILYSDLYFMLSRFPHQNKI